MFPFIQPKIIRVVLVTASLLAIGFATANLTPAAATPTKRKRAKSAKRPPQQVQNYRQVRQFFVTQLTRRTSSPQTGEAMQAAPQGATLITYQQSPRLDAWIGAPMAGTVSAKSKWPAVLFLHGGFALGAEDWQMAEPYRRAGFAVMIPALRGENGQQGAFSLFYDEVEDVVAAGKFMATLPQLDPKRIFVAGHSVGGTLTQLAALSTTTFRAAASFSGSANQREWLSTQPELAPFDVTNESELAVRSSESFAGDFLCPIRLYCGNSETWCIIPSLRTAVTARRSGKDVVINTVPGDHYTAVPEEMNRSITFFKSMW